MLPVPPLPPLRKRPLRILGLAALALLPARVQAQVPAARPKPQLPAVRPQALTTLAQPVFAALDSGIITFEEFTTPGPGQGGQVRVNDQYPGVTFNSAWVLDYSKGLTIPGFAHSGTRAIVLCYGIEFCTDTTFRISFARPRKLTLRESRLGKIGSN